MHTPVCVKSHDGSTQARIVPSRGFTCIELTTEIQGASTHVLDTETGFLSGHSRAGRSGIPILFPFPNRIRDGRFSYRGAEYHVPPPDWFPQTIHGFCLDRPWKVLELSTEQVVGEFLLSRDAPDRFRQWPADARLTVTYRVLPQRLRADFVVENPDQVPLPWGLGTHPYFRLPLSGKGLLTSSILQANATRAWELDQCYPTGAQSDVPADKDLRPGWRYGSTWLDDAYTGVTQQADAIIQTISDTASGWQVTQRCSKEFRELVVFTPRDRSVICVEPYTCVTDAANLQTQGIDAGWQELAPGARAHLWFEIAVSKHVVHYPETLI